MPRPFLSVPVGLLALATCLVAFRLALKIQVVDGRALPEVLGVLGLIDLGDQVHAQMARSVVESPGVGEEPRAYCRQHQATKGGPQCVNSQRGKSGSLVGQRERWTWPQ